MRLQRIYCGARDQIVQILITDSPTVIDGQAPVFDSEIICLEIGEPCTGTMCPLGAEAPVAMPARLIRNALATDTLSVVRRYCAECGRTTEFALVEGGELTCMICGGHRHEELGRHTAPSGQPH